MSDAMRKSFFSELKAQALEKWKVKLSDEDIVPNFAFCKVHFQRSRKRVSQNHSIVPEEEEEEFNSEVQSLLDYPYGNFHLFKKHCTKILSKYPLASNWLKWHLQPDRAIILFPACKTKSAAMAMKHMSSDTNAQENVGKQFQELLSPKKHITLQEAIRHIYRFCDQHQKDRGMVLGGYEIDYGMDNKKLKLGNKRRKVTKYYNDGRPPDTSSKLIPKSERKPVMSTDGFTPIPWSFKYNNLSYTNTCRLDSFLQLFHYLDSKNLLHKPLKKTLGMDSLLMKSLAYLKNNDHATARFIWQEKLMGTRRSEWNRSKTDWFGSLPDLFSIEKELFLLTLQWKSLCSNTQCPNRKEHVPMKKQNSYVGFPSNTSFMKEEFLKYYGAKEDATCGYSRATEMVILDNIPNEEIAEKCHGPAIETEKQITRWPHFFTFVLNLPNQLVTQLPEKLKMLGKTLVLRGTIHGDQLHFVTWVKDGNKWIFFDGIETKGAGMICLPKLHTSIIKEKCNQYMLMGAFFEVMEEEDNVSVSSGSTFDMTPLFKNKKNWANEKGSKLER